MDDPVTFLLKSQETATVVEPCIPTYTIDFHCFCVFLYPAGKKLYFTVQY